ncbi:hypothetical protein C7446_0334 [Kushneria sinocarnis]|uniref:Uncharacterized protein n=1 Tax=Kushneria sinocarnis TaxID=595502 RepID=A0A420X137_9GAMM|nr:hypothetical protein [Kushneria sinocarnis]RKR07522.1 hypothetical protein C7446_0334 [Kushneria sinocarnis]
MSDQAAGLRAWHQRQHAAVSATPLLVLGAPADDELERALAALPSPGGRGWRPVTPAAAADLAAVRHRLLWFDVVHSEVAEVYRALKRLAAAEPGLPVLLLVSAEPDPVTAQVLDNLMTTARHFLGLTLMREPQRWLTPRR